MDFNPGSTTDNTFGITVAKGQTLTADVQWAEPWYGVKTDLDVFLLDENGAPLELEEGARDNVGGTKKPAEIIQWENTTGSAQNVQLAINRCSGSCNPKASESATPRLKLALLENGLGVTSTEYPVSSGGDVVGPTIFGHAGAAAVLSVGAVPFDNSSEPEQYSSRGPVAHYYAPVSGTTPAQKLPSAEVISKPDIAATDCGMTTFFAYHEGSTWRFCGTSAAAPHAAAVAALLLQRNALLSPFSVRSVLSSTASPVGGYGPTAVGAGLVNAVGALEAVEPAAARVEEAVQGSRTASEEVAGTTSSTAGTSSTTSAPNAFRVFFIRHPHKVVRTRGRAARVRFRFGSNLSSATFICSVDRHRFHGCARTLVRSFSIGSHVLRIGIRLPSGAVAPVTASYRFRVEPYPA
jgi:subtilisin family serine protease